ncbi:MAG: hypothetical protein VKK94_04555 [Cyanobacteriota bacterium]|nr:hypothetical protein [Cyanobacteriota bacterium]
MASELPWHQRRLHAALMQVWMQVWRLDPATDIQRLPNRSSQVGMDSVAPWRGGLPAGAPSETDGRLAGLEPGA